MYTINLQEFTEDAAYQVHAVLETLSRLDERVEVRDGERLVGTILRGDAVEDDESIPEGVEEGSPALGKDISLDALLDRFQKIVEEDSALSDEQPLHPTQPVH